MIKSTNKIIEYDSSELYDVRFAPYCFNNKNKELYITVYEQCLLVDIANYYLKNSYKDIICFFVGSNYNEDPFFNIYLIISDFKNNILNNIENIKKEIIGAFTYAILDKLKLINQININDISSIEFYSNQITPINWSENTENNFDYNSRLNEKLSYLKNPDDYFILKSYCTYLFNVFINALYIPYSNIFNLLSNSKVILLKYNNNDIVYLINNYEYRYNDIIDYTKNNQFYEYIIEKEYYANESNNKIIRVNDFYSYYNYLKLDFTINNDQLLKYNNIIKPWAQENIYPNINYIDEYRLIGLCKPLNYYGFDPEKRDYQKAYIDKLPIYNKKFEEKIIKLKNDSIFSIIK